jgi:elongation factor Ts
MSDITPQLVKTLRDKTNAGMMDCKRALAEVGGNLEKAEDYLRKKGILKAASKSSRTTKEGIVASYIHMQGKVGVMVEVNCETDFVAKNEGFRDFVKDITLHIAAASPICVSREFVPTTLVEREREIAREQVKGKPAAIIEKIVEGKIDKYYSTICLLDQAFIKNPDVTVQDFIKSKISEIGENIIIRRFVRYAVGEALDGGTTVEAPAE